MKTENDNEKELRKRLRAYRKAGKSISWLRAYKRGWRALNKRQ